MSEAIQIAYGLLGIGLLLGACLLGGFVLARRLPAPASAPQVSTAADTPTAVASSQTSPPTPLVAAPAITLTPSVAMKTSAPPLSPALASPSPQAPPVAAVDFGQISPQDKMVLQVVPAGEFLMGAADSESSAESYEKPQHSVLVSLFWIDRTEVTNEMFAQFASATGYQTDAEKTGAGAVWVGGNWSRLGGADWRHPEGPSSSLDGLGDHPVVQVSWNDADAYCQWARRRLPTEAEWEKAARGTDGRRYPWGSTPPDGKLANFADRHLSAPWADKSADDGYALTAPVGSYPAGASPYGALDMAGNVWEWTNDWYSEYYYVHTASRDPLGPRLGYLRVVRGGAWFDVASELSVFNRSSLRLSPALWSDFTGFRCAVSPAPPALGDILRSPPAEPTATLALTDTSAYISGITPHAREIFLQGQSLGNNAHAFALVGDSNTDNPAFFAPFDTAGAFNLGPYPNLQAAVDWFHGSFSQHSPAAVGSFSTARALDPAYASASCRPGETPLACEYRLQRPSVSLILIGTGDHQMWQTFETRYRQIITTTLSLGIVPVLITKADDMEAVFGDADPGYINSVIEHLGAEYDIPLLNLRRVVNTLPGHGCGPDGFHYSTPPDGRTADFTGDHLNYGFPVRNLTALQALEVLRREVLTVRPSGGAP